MFHHITSHHRLTPRAMDNKQHTCVFNGQLLPPCSHEVFRSMEEPCASGNDPCSANCVRTCFDVFRKDGRFDPTGGQKESHSACVELQEPEKQTVLHKPGDEPSFLLWHPPSKRLDGLAKRFLCGVVTPQDLCPKERNWSLEYLFIVPRVLRLIFALVLLSRSFHDMGARFGVMWVSLGSHRERSWSEGGRATSDEFCALWLIQFGSRHEPTHTKTQR